VFDKNTVEVGLGSATEKPPVRNSEATTRRKLYVDEVEIF